MPRDWVFPIVLACFVGVVVWFGHQIHDFLLPPADTVTVPSFVGQNATDAADAATRMNLASNVVGHQTSDRYPKGVVMHQLPDAGTKVRGGRQISLIVSDGMVSWLMPDLRYQSMREVGLDLTRTHLQLGKITYVKSDVVPEGHVIDQNPEPLANVNEGDTVNLVVSRGGSAYVTVPKFLGTNIDQARDAATKSGVKIGQIVWTPLGDNGPKRGIIVRQTVPPNARIASYEPVSLQVSAGPNESGYILRQVRVLASIPVSQDTKPGDSVEVLLRVHDATGEYDAYRAYGQPGQKIDFMITAVGTSVVDLYVNNALVGETRLGNEPPKIYGTKRKPTSSPSPTATAK